METGHHRHIQQGDVLAAMPGARRGLGHPWGVTRYVNHLYHMLVRSGAYRRPSCIPKCVRLNLGGHLPMLPLRR